MKSLSKILLEKLKINKDTKVENILIDIKNCVEEFLNHKIFKKYKYETKILNIERQSLYTVTDWGHDDFVRIEFSQYITKDVFRTLYFDLTKYLKDNIKNTYTRYSEFLPEKGKKYGIKYIDILIPKQENIIEKLKINKDTKIYKKVTYNCYNKNDRCLLLRYFKRDNDEVIVPDVIELSKVGFNISVLYYENKTWFGSSGRTAMFKYIYDDNFEFATKYSTKQISIILSHDESLNVLKEIKKNGKINFLKYIGKNNNSEIPVVDMNNNYKSLSERDFNEIDKELNR